MTSSVWNTVWGDGILVVGHELWDDGNDSDNQGCKPDWSGSLQWVALHWWQLDEIIDLKWTMRWWICNNTRAMRRWK